MPVFDVATLRKDFPILGRSVRGQPLTYLDNAATSQKPLVVIKALERYYSEQNANVHRGVYPLAEAATELYKLERLRGSGLESARGNPRGWGRDGTGLNIPRLWVYAGEDEAPEPLLALVDTEPDNTGGWLMNLDATVPVAPGQRLADRQRRYQRALGQIALPA